MTRRPALEVSAVLDEVGKMRRKRTRTSRLRALLTMRRCRRRERLRPRLRGLNSSGA